MTKELTYPSVDFPAEPIVTMSVPDDWLPAWMPGALVAARRQGDDDFAPNVVITSARYRNDFSFDDAISALRDGLDNRPGIQLSDPIAVTFGDENEYTLVNAVYDDARAGTVVQVHAWTSLPVGPSHKDLVHAMGTCSAVDRETAYPQLQQVMNTIRVRRQ